MLRYMIVKSDNDVDFDLYFYDNTLRTYFYIWTFKYNAKVTDIIDYIRVVDKDALIKLEWCF